MLFLLVSTREAFLCKFSFLLLVTFYFLQKQVRMTEQTDACFNKPETILVEEASLAENQAQFCQSISMVAHMTPSFYASENQLSHENGFATNRKPAAMEIDCSMQTDEEDQAVATEKIPACHNDYSWYRKLLIFLLTLTS